MKPQHGKAGKARGVQSFVFPRFPRFLGCSKSILEPASSGLFLVSRSSIFPRFPRFPCCSGFTFGLCSSSPVLVSRSSIFPRFPGWLFGPSQHPPGNPGKRGNGGSDLPGKEAGVRGPMVFFVGLSWMQQREAIRRAADAGARPRISAQGSQILRGTSIAGREPASESRQPSRCTPPSPGLRSRCSLAGALQPKHLTVAAAPGLSQWLQPQMPSAALSPAAPPSPQSLQPRPLTVAAAPPRCPQHPLALQPPKPSQSLQPPSPHSPVVEPPRPSQSLQPQGPHCSSSVLNREDG